MQNKPKQFLRLAFLILAIHLIIISYATAITVTFQNGVSPASGYNGCADTYVHDQNPSTNYGDVDPIVAGRNYSGNRRILIKFDLSSIPKGCIITSAILYLYPNTTQTQSLNCYALTNDWTESGATWNTYDGNNPWSSPGGDYDTSRIASCFPNNGWHTWTVDTKVQVWIDGTAQNYGFLIRYTGNRSYLNSYSSSENSTASNRPILVVSYDLTDTAPPAAVSDLSATDGEAKATLSWTAPGDDGTTGDITDGQYRIKYTTSGQITDDNQWDSAPYEVLWTMNTSPGNTEVEDIFGLTGGTTYWFAIKTADESGQWASLSNSIKAVPARDTTAPVISSITVTGISNTQATINWKTNKPTYGWVEYGTSVSYGQTSSTDPLNTNHSITLINLIPQTTYHFRVFSKDMSNNQSNSGDTAFTTVLLENEHLWLHADGKYLRTSSSANPPDSTFIPIGASYTEDASVYGCAMSTSYLLDLKSKGVNFIRYRFYFIATTNYASTNSIDFNRLIKEKLNEAVVRCKNNGLYIIFDDHEYFHNTGSYPGVPSFAPAGSVWSENQIQNTWIAGWVAIANAFKDEPWVMGYQLQNEPYIRYEGELTGGQVRDFYTRCLKAIRVVDKRHIIFLGSKFWSGHLSLEETWADVDYRPDAPYNQVVFDFHAYCPSINEGGFGYLRAGPVTDEVRKKYRVALLCLEAGPVEGDTAEINVDFWIAFLSMCKYRNLGWNNWLQTSQVYDYPEIWSPVAQSMRSSIPAAGTPPGPANRIVCTADNTSLPADSTSYTFVEARIVDANGITVPAVTTFTFSISGGGSIISDNPAGTSFGVAAVRIKTSSNVGTITVTVTAEAAGLNPASVGINTTDAGLLKTYTTDWRPPVTTRLRGASSSMTVGKSTGTTVLGVCTAGATSANLELIAYDIDFSSEVNIYINGKGPIIPPSSIAGDEQYKKVLIPIDLNYLTNGYNPVRYEYRGGDKSRSIHGVNTWVGFNIESTKILVNFPGNIIPLSITNVEVSYVNETTVTISWNTDRPATSQIAYGKTQNCELTTAEDGALILNHSITLTGIETGIQYYYKVISKDESGNQTSGNVSNFTITPAVTYPQEVKITNYPNPFNDTTTFLYGLPQKADSAAEIVIYTLSGELVRKLTASELAGYHNVTWDGCNEEGNKISSGIYIYLLTVKVDGSKFIKPGKMAKKK